MPIGSNIRIFLADQSVTGIRYAEIVNWTLQAVACPRGRVTALKNWPEVCRPGVYVLFGIDDQTGRELAYIGEAEIVVDRLIQHLSGKPFWSEVVSFTSKDDNLTKAHVRYLEARLHALASEAHRYALENSAVPQESLLPRGEAHAMEEVLGGIRTLLGVLGHRLLEPLLVPGSIGVQEDAAVSGSATTPLVELDSATSQVELQTNAKELFHFRARDLVASARRTNEGFVVLEGSEAAPDEQASLSARNRQIRAQLLEDGTLIAAGSKLRFARPALFNSPSQAASVIVGYSINGPLVWRTSAGSSLSDIDQSAANMALQDFLAQPQRSRK